MKIKIGILFGGLSNEYEVSLSSAENIIKYIDKEKYEVIEIGFGLDGNFYTGQNILGKFKEKKYSNLQSIDIGDCKKEVDVVFPITHGKFGEDGCIQGLLEVIQIPYVGCGVLSSALCMDKGIFKTLLQTVDIPQVKFLIIDYKVDSDKDQREKIENVLNNFNFPIFIKPANSGSSVGVNKIKDKDKSLINKSIKDSLEHDSKIVIEEAVLHAREIEIAVLGNRDLIISEPGEVIPSQEYYNYLDKYELNLAQFKIPAQLSSQQISLIKSYTTKVYKLFNCQGFARIDFFVDGKSGRIFLNEINTLPGFTNISMYPMLMKHKGIGFTELIDRLITLSLDRSH